MLSKIDLDAFAKINAALDVEAALTPPPGCVLVMDEHRVPWWKCKTTGRVFGIGAHRAE